MLEMTVTTCVKYLGYYYNFFAILFNLVLALCSFLYFNVLQIVCRKMIKYYGVVVILQPLSLYSNQVLLKYKFIIEKDLLKPKEQLKQATNENVAL